MTTLKFDHNQEQIHCSMGISDNRADQLSAGILFEIINQAYLLDKLFSKPEEAPKNMRTKTGIMERILEDTANEAEMLYTMWEFAKIEVLQNTNDKRAEKMHTAMTMLFMMSGMDKDKFIQNYIDRKRQAQQDL